MTRGEENVAWIEQHCVVPEGAYAGSAVKLSAFQRNMILRIYDSPVPIRKVIISFGRKNGKTAFVSFLLLLHLCGPEYVLNGQLVSTGQSRDQAALLHRYAMKTAQLSPTLSLIVKPIISTKRLLCEELGTEYRALSAEASRNLGLSPFFAVHDELGQVKGPTSPLFDAVETAMGAHRHPLSIIISTQSPTDNDLLSREIDDAASGADPSTLLFLFTADPALPLDSVEAMYAANPALGDFLSLEETKRKAADALRMPSKAASFRNLILNQRISATEVAISPTVWTENGGEVPEFDEELPVYGGLDLAETSDLAAYVLIQPQGDIIAVKSTFWLPAVGLLEKSQEDRECYDVWAREGHLLTTEGRTLDFDEIGRYIYDSFDQYNNMKVAYDRWRWKTMRKSLQLAGFDEYLLDPDGTPDQKKRSVFSMFGQGFQSMSPAWTKLESGLLTCSFRHGMHPVLTMCARNAVLATDPAGNKKVAKNKSRGRVDGIVALVMACGVRMLTEEVETSRTSGWIHAIGGTDDGEGIEYEAGFRGSFGW